MKRCNSFRPKKKRDVPLRLPRREWRKSSRSSRTRLIGSRRQRLSRRLSGDELRSSGGEKRKLGESKKRTRSKGYTS